MDWTTIGAAAGGVGALVKAGYVAATGFSETNVTWVNGHKHVEHKEPWAGPGLTAVFYAVLGVAMLIGATHTQLGHTIRGAMKTQEHVSDKMDGIAFVVFGPILLALLAFCVVFGFALVGEGIRERTAGTAFAGLFVACFTGAMAAYVALSWYLIVFG
jgi:hypothetical protein